MRSWWSKVKCARCKRVLPLYERKGDNGYGSVLSLPEQCPHCGAETNLKIEVLIDPDNHLINIRGETVRQKSPLEL